MGRLDRQGLHSEDEVLQNRLEAVEALLRVLKAAQPREVGREEMAKSAEMVAKPLTVNALEIFDDDVIRIHLVPHLLET